MFLISHISSAVRQRDRELDIANQRLRKADHDKNLVEVTISFAGQAPALRIADHGIGIDGAALPHIFEDFYRSQDAAQFNSQGTGLGLAIVRQVARNLGLTLNVESNKGEGTTFEVLFPAERRNKDGNDHNH